MEINLANHNPVPVDERWKRLYSFTTENISGYYESLPEGKGNALTVCGSGDHIINLALSGKENITAFDVNRDALYFAHLKLSALGILSLDEFLTCFMGQDKNSFSYSIFKELRPHLVPEVSEYFETRYKEAGYDGLKLFRSLFNLKHACPETKRRSNPYLRNAALFTEAKRSLHKAKVSLCCSAAETSDFRLPGSPYDVILLSNLADHAPRFFNHADPLAAFVNHVINPALSSLRTGGKLFAAYLYDLSSGATTAFHSAVDDPVKRKECMAVAGVIYREHVFESVIPGRKDAVVILEKQAWK